jgi:Zn-finger nucleic acid-binding protein
MKCPVCPNAALIMTDRQGIEIDYCPSCRGVWLDRGELDKIIERSTQQAPAQAAPQQPHYPPQPQPQYPPQQHYPSKHHGHYKHKSWLADLFD